MAPPCRSSSSAIDRARYFATPVIPRRPRSYWTGGRGPPSRPGSSARSIGIDGTRSGGGRRCGCESFPSSRPAEYLGCKNVLAVTSCTGAMHLSLLALGVGPGDEVITTPMTFIATATAIIEAGATPVFVDVEEKTGNLDAGKVEAALTERTRAILPVHLYG